MRITVEVGQGAARYKVAVRAKSVRRALEIVGRQNMVRDANVKLPTDPEAFFIRDVVATADGIGPEAA
jgi:hypothetical protein